MKTRGWWRPTSLFVCLVTIASARGQPTGPSSADEAPTTEVPAEALNDAPGYTPDEGSSEGPLRITGYIDVGFAKAQGNGTSFRSGDTRIPADYGVDTFAPAVNSRGDVASLDSGGRYLNGFLPDTVNIGGRASFLINTVDIDIRYAPQSLPVFVFARTQLLPRFGSGGNDTRLVVEQAFGRISPFSSVEFALSLGKFDSVFGIEYLDNQANIRTGITPSLIARYTTGQSIGAKVFYRMQIPSLWSAVSLNIAATNSGPWVQTLQTPNISLTGLPNLAGRLGYELNLARFQLKLGGSGWLGPRNDQHDSHVGQHALGADARVAAGWVSASVEYVNLREDQGTQPGKFSGTGTYEFASGFHVYGYYGQLAVALPVRARALQTVTVYARYDRRHAEFEGFGAITTSRVTTGMRLELWSTFALKAEYLFNRELDGAPTVANDVFTSSAVFTW